MLDCKNKKKSGKDQGVLFSFKIFSQNNQVAKSQILEQTVMKGLYYVTK